MHHLCPPTSVCPLTHLCPPTCMCLPTPCVHPPTCVHPPVCCLPTHLCPPTTCMSGPHIYFLFFLRYDINRNLLLLCFLLLNAIFLAVIPMCRTLWLLILSTAAAGFSVGILDTATNVQLIGIHGKKVTGQTNCIKFLVVA